MKVVLTVSVLLLGLARAQGQGGNVGIGTTLPDSTAKLDLSSTTQGFLPPRMTAAQRTAIRGAAAGLMVFQTDGNPGMYYYDGVANWRSLTSGKQVAASGYPADYGSVTTLAGSGVQGSTNGTGAGASFGWVLGVAVDAAGYTYVSDYQGQTIRRITPAGVVATFAGSGSAGSTDATGTAASFRSPGSLVFDASGNLYVADNGNSKIRKITPAGVVTTFAGSGVSGSADDTGAAATFTGPLGLTIDAAGNLYVSQYGDHRIRKVTPAAVVTTIAGSGTAGSANGTGTAATFSSPTGIAADRDGNLYVSDQQNNKIRKISPAGVVTTLAGSATNRCGFVNGTGSAALFCGPNGVATDVAGNVYVADGATESIRKITPGGVVTTLAGSGSAGDADALGPAASFRLPWSITVDAMGNVYVGERNGYRVRKISTQ